LVKDNRRRGAQSPFAEVCEAVVVFVTPADWTVNSPSRAAYGSSRSKASLQIPHLASAEMAFYPGDAQEA